MKKLYILFILSFFYTSSFAQVFTLIDSFPASGGVKLGPDGHIYIGNYGDGLPNANGTQIWRYHLQEDSLELFVSGLSGASGNTFGPDGNFYQSNISSGVISKVTPTGQVSTYASGLSSPVGIVADDIGNLFVCECGSNEISKVDTLGNVSLFSSGFLFACPNGITRDQDGNLYVSNFNNSDVVKITPNGQEIALAFIPGNNNGHLTYSSKDSCLYIASHGSSKIYKSTLSGNVSTIAGSGTRGNADGNLNQATFSRPNGIAMSSSQDTIFLNSSIPLTNGPSFPLNPSKLRAITGFRTVMTKASEEEKIAFNIYPNPTKGIIEITGLVKGKYKVYLRSLNGKTVHESDLTIENTNAHYYDLSKVQEGFGVYFLAITNPEFFHSQKIILTEID
ncbi:MAG: T9SS type A sorting domain-containing protein [Cytophagales bacterium]